MLSTQCADACQRPLSIAELVLNTLPAAIGVFDSSGQALYLNAAFRNLREAAIEARQSDALEALWACGDARTTIDVDGRVISVENTPISEKLHVCVQQDISSLVKATKLSEHLAAHDALTGLANQASFQRAVDTALTAAVVAGGRVSVVIASIDGFGMINDLYGTLGADEALRQLTGRFRNVVEADDLLARIGSSGFAFVSAEGAQPDTALSLCERLMGVAATPISFDETEFDVRLSFGMAISPCDGMTAEALLNGAEAALARARTDGGGVLRVFSPDMDHAVRARRGLACDLAKAIALEQLELHYQPQAKVSGEIFGYEALIRWRHPERGLISPDTFIPIAEESGLIVAIGRWVLERACLEAVSWTEPLRVSVNISPVQFRSEDLPGIVAQVIAMSGLDPSRLELEITEGVLIGNPALASGILSAISAEGVKIAMDDFGTGYSSLSYLQAFPCDTIKIDKCFIRRIAHDPRSREIVRAIVGLGHGLGIPVIAEGVETEDEREFLEKAGCDNIQGYLVGRPRPKPSLAVSSRRGSAEGRGRAAKAADRHAV